MDWPGSCSATAYCADPLWPIGCWPWTVCWPPRSPPWYRAVESGDGSFLPVAVVLTLVGFISTATVARFIEGQGR
ncbi:MAG: MrpF/PhaF family protein [Microthrixaceae bacterium]|nr:MrpF/PhaF family protein [Microthrixaceae bacterium]